MVRAWKALDPESRVALSRQEFVKSVPATGYAGNPANVWTALVGEGKTASLRELDPELTKQLVAFRNAIVGRGQSLEKAFEGDCQPMKCFTLDDFKKLCRKAHCPKPWGSLFQALTQGDTVSWADVRFLEEQWSWKEDEQGPKRQPPKAQPAELLVRRTAGEGALCTFMRPRKVVLPKSNSLPALFMPLRANWNDRHQVLDHLGNRSEQLLHELCHVQCQAQERVKRRVAQKMQEVSTVQWFAETYRTADDDYDDENLEGDA